MTIEELVTVKEMLAEELEATIYQYRHRITGRVLYAFFLRNQWDDMHLAPMVTESILLLEKGLPTDAGRAFLFGNEIEKTESGK